MKNRYKISSVALLVGCWSVSGLSQGADIRDPFSPFLSGSLDSVNSGVVDGVQAEPLKKFPAENYLLTGVISSKKSSMALITTPEGDSFLMIEGDMLGADDFKIESIERVRVELVDLSGNKMTKRVLKSGGSAVEN